MINDDIRREFGLINENNEEYSFMDLENQALLTNPNGLGFTFNNSLELLSTTFILTNKKLNSTNFNGALLFKSYDAYKNFVDYVAKSKNIRLAYKIPYKEEDMTFYRNVTIKSLTKSDLDTRGYLSETITFNFLSLWYRPDRTIFDIADADDEIRWDFVWDSRTQSYEEREIVFVNKGHVVAPFKINLLGIAVYPKINIFDKDNNNIFSLELNLTIAETQRLMYSSVDGDLYIKVNNGDGTFTNLFTEEFIDVTKPSIFKLPLGESRITISCDNDITGGELSIYDSYLGV